jgi:hypothetical protein
LREVKFLRRSKEEDSIDRDHISPNSYAVNALLFGPTLSSMPHESQMDLKEHYSLAAKNIDGTTTKGHVTVDPSMQEVMQIHAHRLYSPLTVSLIACQISPP